MHSESLGASTALARYGKSFYWASHFLGHEMALEAATLYRFCRVLDDLADDDIKNGPQRLLMIRDDLVSSKRARDPLHAGFEKFIKKKRLPIRVIVALIDGLLIDQTAVRISDESELLRYCYRVAGTVGLLMCKVLNCDEKKALPHAIDLGIAMQLTNIARDILEDANIGRRYLPKSWVGDITPEEIVKTAEKPDADLTNELSRGVEMLIALSDEYYESGLSGSAYLPARAHFAIGVAALVYRKIGKRIVASNYAWHRGRQTTSLVEKIVTSTQVVPLFYERFKQKKAHRSELHLSLKGLPYVHLR